MKTKFSTCASRAHILHHIRCIGYPLGVPTDLQSVVKKGSTY